MFDLLDKVMAPALWARKKPLPIDLNRQHDDLPQQVSFVRFLKGQKAVASLTATAKNMDLDALLLRLRPGHHPISYRVAPRHTSAFPN